MMNIEIDLPIEQIQLIATKLGYQSQIEDTSQPLDGDSYPLIDNPLTLEKFVETSIGEILLNQVKGSLRTGAMALVDNLHNQAIGKISTGHYDDALMQYDTKTVLQLIISDHAV